MHFVQDVCDTKEGQSSRGLEPAMPGAFPSDWQHLKRFFNTNLLSQGQPNRPLHGGFSRQALQGESPTCVGLRCQVKLISNVQIPEILRCSSVSMSNVSTCSNLYLILALFVCCSCTASVLPKVYKSGWADTAWVNYVAVPKNGGGCFLNLWKSHDAAASSMNPCQVCLESLLRLAGICCHMDCKNNGWIWMVMAY